MDQSLLGNIKFWILRKIWCHDTFFYRFQWCNFCSYDFSIMVIKFLGVPKGPPFSHHVSQRVLKINYSYFIYLKSANKQCSGIIEYLLFNIFKKLKKFITFKNFCRPFPFHSKSHFVFFFHSNEILIYYKKIYQ